MSNVQVFVGMDDPVLSDLRNGVLANVAGPARRGAIPPMYYWDYVAGGDDNASILTVYVSLAYGRLVEAQPDGGVPGPGDRASYADFALAGPLAASLRRDAIILGGVRAGVASAYRIVHGDLVATECNGAVTATLNGGRTAYAFTTGHTDANGDLTRFEAAAVSFGDVPMSVDENDLYFGMLRFGMGLPPIVGVSLLEHQHHYLTGNAQGFVGFEKQVADKLSDGAKALWLADAPRSRDLAFHKACHPVSSGVLHGLARDTALPLKITRAGLGAAAVRLPFVESELKAAKAYIAVVDAIRTFCAIAGYKIEVPALTLIAAYVSSIPDGGPVPGPPAGIIAPANRAAGVRDLVVPAMARVASFVAVACGIYMALVEESGLALNQDSRLTAFSIVKLRKMCPADVAQGTTSVRDFRRYQKKSVENGDLAVFSYTDAAV